LSYGVNGGVAIQPKFILDDFEEERTYLRLNKPKLALPNYAEFS